MHVHCPSSKHIGSGSPEYYASNEAAQAAGVRQHSFQGLALPYYRVKGSRPKDTKWFIRNPGHTLTAKNINCASSFVAGRMTMSTTDRFQHCVLFLKSWKNVYSICNRILWNICFKQSHTAQILPRKEIPLHSWRNFLMLAMQSRTITLL